MYNNTNTLHNDNFIIPKYKPTLKNTIETNKIKTTIKKISNKIT